MFWFGCPDPSPGPSPVVFFWFGLLLAVSWQMRFPPITSPQIHRGGPEPAQSGQAVHYHVHLPSRGNHQPFDLADFFRGFPPGGRYY